MYYADELLFYRAIMGAFKGSLQLALEIAKRIALAFYPTTAIQQRLGSRLVRKRFGITTFQEAPEVWGGFGKWNPVVTFCCLHLQLYLLASQEEGLHRGIKSIILARDLRTLKILTT